MVSDGYKDILSDGAWGGGAAHNRELPETAGLNRGNGWPVGYEQIGSGLEPERKVFNELDYEIDSALIDIAAMGVPAWDVEVDYRPATNTACFVTTATGLHLTFTNTGPAFSNATNPDASGQTVWRLY